MDKHNESCSCPVSGSCRKRCFLKLSGLIREVSPAVQTPSNARMDHEFGPTVRVQERAMVGLLVQGEHREVLRMKQQGSPEGPRERDGLVPQTFAWVRARTVTRRYVYPLPTPKSHPENRLEGRVQEAPLLPQLEAWSP